MSKWEDLFSQFQELLFNILCNPTKDGGLTIRSGECQGHDIRTTYGDLINCQNECLNTVNCASFVHFYKGNDIDTCYLKNAHCSEAEMKNNSDSQTYDFTGT